MSVYRSVAGTIRTRIADTGLRRFDALSWAALGVVVVSLLHELDHLVNQPSGEFSAATVLAVAVSTAVLWLALRRNPLAPLVALSAGIAIAAGFAAVHLADLGAFSNPYANAGVDGLSYAIVYLNIAAALALAAVAAAQLIRRPSLG